MTTTTKYNYPAEYKLFLAHFHGTRDFFECHEILEEYWLEQNKETRWLALIQLAVAVYHERQGNLRGSYKLYNKVQHHMLHDKRLFEELSIDAEQLAFLISKRIKGLEENQPYQPLNLPLIDEDLLVECRNIAASWNADWKNDDQNTPADLRFKHRMRDRSEVIAARKASLVTKSAARY
ncbi:DUF309 domain-containing protein [Alkalicoccus daliensis]|uniref:DUF309 domain-containing protein n=1 Tax=Alkalicoccus daliensis TaxID=745820 RepID=A0A1H0AYY6_9BACI|nr:DUF309 domain-containing protein [Alkalicoccus daliensis]SDN38655.1 hypothetical protein SAMN04488053_101682 [Alkalicoccus daliensis]